MLFILGVIFGFVTGIITSLIPGSTLGVVLLAIPFAPVTFSIPFIITADAVSGILRQLGLLNPNFALDNPNLMQSFKEIKTADYKRIVMNSIFNYSVYKIGGLAVGLLLSFNVFTPLLKLGGVLQFGGIPLALMMWYKVIHNSENQSVKTWSWVVLIFSAALGMFAVHIGGANAMFCLSTALFSIAAAFNNLKQDKSAKTTKKILAQAKVNNAFHFSPKAILGGFIGGIFFGLPLSPVFNLFNIKGKDAEDNILMNSAAQGFSSALGLLLVLTGNGSRSAVATTLSVLVSTLNPVSIFVFLVLSILVTIVAIQAANRCVDFYIRHQHLLSNVVLDAATIILSMAVVSFLMPGVSVLIVGGAFIAQLAVKQGGLPKDIVLSAMSIIPLLGLVF